MRATEEGTAGVSPCLAAGVAQPPRAAGSVTPGSHSGCRQLGLLSADVTREGFVPYFTLLSGHPGHTVSLPCFQRKVCPSVFQELDPEVTCLVELVWKNRTSFCLF